MTLAITQSDFFTRPQIPELGIFNRGRSRLLPPPDDDLTPPDPLEIKNPGNPMSWMEGITKLLSAAEEWMAKIQKKLTEGILGKDGINPVMLRQFMFQAAALIGKMFDLEKYAKEMQKQNQEAEKDTFDLAFAAKGRT